MTLELVPHVSVKTQVVEEVVSLKDAVLFDHPEVLFRNERLQNRYSDVRVIVRTECVANVVEESANNVLVRFVGPVGAGSGLESMLNSIDSESAVITFEQFEMIDDPTRYVGSQMLVVSCNDFPIRCSSFGHGSEGGGLFE